MSTSHFFYKAMTLINKECLQQCNVASTFQLSTKAFLHKRCWCPWDTHHFNFMNEQQTIPSVHWKYREENVTGQVDCRKSTNIFLRLMRVITVYKKSNLVRWEDSLGLDHAQNVQNSLPESLHSTPSSTIIQQPIATMNYVNVMQCLGIKSSFEASNSSFGA